MRQRYIFQALDLSSSGMLRSVNWQLVTDVSGQLSVPSLWVK